MRKIHFPILGQIVGRCHVSDSIDSVLSYAISRLKHGQKTFDAMDCESQHAFIADCRQLHLENQKLYITVMKGF
jgi:hypothetical protein